MLVPSLRVQAAVPLALTSLLACSLWVAPEDYVSKPAGPSEAGSSSLGGGAGAPAAQPELRASFAVLGGQRGELSDLGAFSTDVTLGAFSATGELLLWPAWTLPAPGLYVAAHHANETLVFGDPVNSGQQNVIWQSAMIAGLLSPWKLTSAPLAARWAAVTLSATDVIAIASEAEGHVGSELSLLSLNEPTAWRSAGVSLLTARVKTVATVCRGHLFVVGGEVPPESDPDASAKVESAPITAQGLGPMLASADLSWQGAALTRTDVSLACGAQRLYVIGGDTEPYQEAGSVQVLSGVIGPDGTIAAWDEEPRLGYPVAGAATVVADGRLIVAGGYNAARLDQVAFAELDAEGHVVEWRAEGNPTLPLAVRDAAVVAFEAP